jgi:hypothetical protein
MEEEVEDRLHFIFDKQRELMGAYERIEASNGLLQTDKVPVDIHDRMGQARLKDFAWRVTEELMESLEAYRLHPELDTHYKEEIADAFHFLVELAILSGIGPAEIGTATCNRDALSGMFSFHTGARPFDQSIVEVILSVGRGMNLLKNKPWKNTHMVTDVPRYAAFIIESFRYFAAVCTAGGMTPDDLFDLYFRKSEVNKFRIRSNY